MIDHETLISDSLESSIGNRDDSWFDKHGRLYSPTNLYSLAMARADSGLIPDLQATRAIAAHHLGIAHHKDVFFREHGQSDPKPTETDRLLYCEFIEFQLSITGLLNLQEIQKIRDRGWWNEEIASMPGDLFFQKEIKLPDFEEVSVKTKSWKKEGWRIVLFHGAFDPVTVTHLQNATQAYSYGKVTKVPIKFVVGFDSDKLIKRKGSDRPRYPLADRRQQLGRFWMVDETVVLRANKPTTAKFVLDYIDLGVDYVVTTMNPDELIVRSKAIMQAGIDTIPIHESPLPNATTLLNISKME